MKHLLRAWEIASQNAIFAGVASTLFAALVIWGFSSLWFGPTNSTEATSLGEPSAAETTMHPGFDNFPNPLTGIGCDSQCLPVAYALVRKDNKISIELYNQAFGISEINGTLKLPGTTEQSFLIDYAPGGHSQTTFEIPETLVTAGAIFELCAFGQIEETEQKINWTASYQFPDPIISSEYQQIARKSPMRVRFGEDASPC